MGPPRRAEKSHHLGTLQIAIMRILWRRREAATTDVHQDLQEERPLALTTIATMLAKMEKKGVVLHRTEGRKFVYRPRVTEEQVKQSMVSELLDRLFEGRGAELASHLLSREPIDAGELRELKALIREREKKERS
ncbi:MAG: BlaI/MecI/CopY family transcriptional regulator [Acidobacteriota bacterium]